MQFKPPWKLLHKTLEYEGFAEAATGSPRGVIKAAYATYDFIDEELWLDMLADRNAAEHVCDAALAQRLVAVINGEYISAFIQLASDLEGLYAADLLEAF